MYTHIFGSILQYSSTFYALVFEDIWNNIGRGAVRL